MALAIGQSTASFARAPRVDVGDLARDASAAAAKEVRLGKAGEQDKGAGPRGFFEKDEPISAQRAVNAQGAALSTIDKGVKNARRIVPDVKDILDLAKERFTQSREARLAEQEASREASRNESRARAEQSARPAPSPQVSRFFGQEEEGPKVLGLPQNPVGNEKPVVNFSGAQPKPSFDIFA